MNVQTILKPAFDKSVFTEAAEQLIAAGKFLDSKGWAPATSGNYSARLDNQFAAITVSGYHKGRLDTNGIMTVDMEGRATDHRKPSAETALHTMLYKLDESIGSVLHTHSVNAVVLTRALKKNKLKLEGYELLKAFKGIETHDTAITVPIFDNTQDITALSEEVKTKIQGRDDVRGFLIRGHGLYTWGGTVAEAQRAVEAFEFLFECEMQQWRLK